MSKNRRQFIQDLGLLMGTAATGSLSINPSHANDTTKRPPNILLFYPDQHRFDWLGTTPDIPVNTPYVDALAREGVRFNSALCPSPLCAPSRACLASGKEYDRCQVPTNGTDYPLEQTTFYQLLREAGYHVSGCGKFDLHKASPTWGIDGQHRLPEWGFTSGIDNAGKWDAVNSGREEPKDPYMHYLHTHNLAQTHVEDFLARRKARKGTFPTPLPPQTYCDNWLAGNGIELLRQIPQDQPWFMQVNFTGPHEPFDITKRMYSWYKDIEFPQPNRNNQFEPSKHNAIRQNYSAMVENIDKWIQVYLNEIAQRGELDNTLVVFSSDHGEMLGDHNMWGKTKPYHPSASVPLTIWGPGVRKGHVSDAVVTNLDLTATFLQYAGIKKPKDMDSVSLCPLLSGGTDAHREYALSGYGDWRLVFDGRYKLIQGFGKNKEPMLFDLQEDPQENHNIASKARDIYQRLNKILEKA